MEKTNLRKQSNSETDDAESSRWTGSGCSRLGGEGGGRRSGHSRGAAAGGAGTSRAPTARGSGAGAEKGAERGARAGRAGQEVRGSRGGRPIVRWRRRPGARGPEGGGTRK